MLKIQNHVLAAATFECAVDMFLCISSLLDVAELGSWWEMWKKGSYDVSGKHDISNRLSVVVLSDNHHGGTISRYYTCYY
jgi:hypothetical protein